MQPTTSALEDRYGVRKSARSGAQGPSKLAFGIALAVMLALTLWVAYTFISGNPIKVATVGYEHIGERSIDVSFSITAPPGRALECGVEAFNQNRGQVGFTAVEIPARTERITVHKVRVNTQQAAVSGAVKSCQFAK